MYIPVDKTSGSGWSPRRWVGLIVLTSDWQPNCRVSPSLVAGCRTPGENLVFQGFLISQKVELLSYYPKSLTILIRDQWTKHCTQTPFSLKTKYIDMVREMSRTFYSRLESIRCFQEHLFWTRVSFWYIIKGVFTVAMLYYIRSMRMCKMCTCLKLL